MEGSGFEIIRILHKTASSSSSKDEKAVYCLPHLPALAGNQLLEHAALFQNRHQNKGQNAAGYGGNQEGHHVNEQTGRSRAYDVFGHRVGRDPAQHACAEGLRHTMYLATG